MAVDYGQWLEELSKRSGASVEQSDLSELQYKDANSGRDNNAGDTAAYMRQLEGQYAQRGASTSHRGVDSQSLDQSKNYDPRNEHKGFSGEYESGNRSVAQQWIQGSTSGGGDSAGGGGGGGGGGGWNNQDPRADALYQQLLGRSQQSLSVGRNDPVIRAQSDAYSANEERSKRNYLGDVAEKQGPLANIAGETRMAAERVGQRTGSFEAELMGRELTSRRQEIAQALSSMQGMLSQDQQAALTRELSALDAAIRREGMSLQGQGMNQQNDQFMRNLALNEWDTGQKWDYNWGSLGG